MDPILEGRLYTNVCTATDGRVVIEQAEGSAVLPVGQIPTIIDQLRACYDFCAAWKERESK